MNNFEYDTGNQTLKTIKKKKTFYELLCIYLVTCIASKTMCDIKASQFQKVIEEKGYLMVYKPYTTSYEVIKNDALTFFPITALMYYAALNMMIEDEEMLDDYIKDLEERGSIIAKNDQKTK